MLNEIAQDATERMQKSVDALVNNFKKIRTGRAHPSILEGLCRFPTTALMCR